LETSKSVTACACGPWTEISFKPKDCLLPARGPTVVLPAQMRFSSSAICSGSTSNVSTPETTVTFFPARALTVIVTGTRFPFLEVETRPVSAATRASRRHLLTESSQSRHPLERLPTFLPSSFPLSSPSAKSFLRWTSQLLASPVRWIWPTSHPAVSALDFAALLGFSSGYISRRGLGCLDGSGTEIYYRRVKVSIKGGSPFDQARRGLTRHRRLPKSLF
jgi:hypothetical protein